MKTTRGRTLCLLILLAFLSLQSGFGDDRIEIYSLRYHIHPTFTRIVIDIGQLREFNYSELPSPDRVYVDLYQTKLNPILHGKSIPVETDYLSRIRIAQRSQNTVRVVVDMDFKKIKRYQVFYLPDPFRVVIDIHPDKPTPSPPPPPKEIPKPARPAKSGYSLARQLGLGVKRIVIDPGHGGKDPGALGKSGLLEKDVVLDISKRLKTLLEGQKDLEIILTRGSDILIPVEDRPVIASQKEADLFISIHANSFPNKNRSGVETYFLNFSQDPAVISVAARENATSTKNIGKMKNIIDKIVRNSKIVESEELARTIQKNLVSRLKRNYKDIKDLGAKGGPYWVLIGGEIPSVLVEVSHLSNTNEEKRLKSAQYRQVIAEGIYSGIITYIKSLGKG